MTVAYREEASEEVVVEIAVVEAATAEVEGVHLADFEARKTDPCRKYNPAPVVAVAVEEAEEAGMMDRLVEVAGMKGVDRVGWDFGDLVLLVQEERFVRSILECLSFFSV